MIKIIKKTIGLASILFLLTACSSISAEDVSEATKEVDKEFTAIIEENNNLNSEENNFDNQFQNLLTDETSLDQLKNKDAEIFQNIEERRKITNSLEEQSEIIEEKAEYISKYDGDELPKEVIQETSKSFSTFSEKVKEYKKNYLNSINLQEDYLKKIAEDDSEYDDFIDGLDHLNEDYLKLQESKESLKQELEKSYKKINKIKEKKQENNESKEKQPDNSDTEELKINKDQLLTKPKKYPEKFVYDSGVNISYPEDGVKGIYTTSHSASGEKMEELVQLINTTDLNAMVIDIKDDHGNITIDFDSENELINEMTNGIIDGKELMETLEENDIYPIARIVVFKDSLLAQSKPDWSFTDSSGNIWENRRNESFVNPYLEDVWDYNIEVAVQAAKLGFKDIQFDYVRFPEGFEKRADSLNYAHGSYVDESEDVISMEYRNRAVTEFVQKSKESLMPYGADLSVDIFGYAALVRETPGIGQSFPGIAQEVDVISSMIYPSHWGLGNLNINKPDLEPYNVVNNYIEVEEEIFEELGEEAPTTRPWLQDFTASYLGAGNYKNYGAKEVTEQIKALADNDIHEYLLWNASNRYSKGATYKYN